MLLHILATSCFPNCHPAGVTYTGVQESGNAALGLVVLIIAGVILKALLTGKKNGQGGGR